MTITNKSYIPLILLSTAMIFSDSINAAVPQEAKKEASFEQISTVKLAITSSVNYGHALNELLSGKVAPPSQGARVDIGFEGELTGILNGKMRGIDYANIRADGRFEIFVQAEITTPDGARISYQATGVSIPQENGTGKIRELVKMVTGFEKYAWVNGHTFIAEGYVNPETGVVALTLLK